MNAVGVSDWIEVDRRGSAHQIFSLFVDMTNGSGRATVEWAIQRDLDSSTVPIPHDVLHKVEESCASRQVTPVTAFRLNVEKYRGGSIVLRILQAGYFGN